MIIIMIGIYRIYNLVSKHSYIGSSKNISSRWDSHRRELNRGVHHSKYLQAAWNKYGEGSFVFEIVELCDQDDLRDREQSMINLIKPEYNISMIVDLPNPPPNRPIIRTNILTGETVIFATRDLAAMDGDFNEGSITSCCHGHASSHRGYFWKFADGSTPEFRPVNGVFNVLRIEIDGYSVQKFPSIRNAEINTPGSTYKGIHACCKKQLKSHAGYRWCFDGYQQVYARSPRRKRICNRAVRRVSIDSNEIYIYSRVSDVKSDGYSLGNVISCCNGHRKSHKRCIWEWDDQTTPRAYESEEKGKGSVIGTSVHTGEIRIYPSISATSVDGFSPGKVSACCLGRRKTHGGYRWQRQ
jgi:hypothetical protein